MRGVRRLSLVRVRDDEHGATLAIVAISLICLLGMLVLTFDLGRGVALKRNMVNAADSGALAAARECGLANGEASSRTAAEQLVADNNSAADVTGFNIDDVAQCNGAASDGKRQVTVTVTVPQDYFFAPIFGFNNGTVVASATAQWTMGETSPAPVKLDAFKVKDCLKDGNGINNPPGYDKGPDCYFTFEKDKTGSQRGWLNLPEGWPIENVDTNPKDCASQKGGSSDLKDYIDKMGKPGDSSTPFEVWAQPTWVCAAGGVPNTAVQAMVDWLNGVAKMVENGELDGPPAVDFPVAACNGGTPPCYVWKTGSQAAYPIVAKQRFRVEGAWQGNPKGWPQDARDNCQFTRKSSDVFCIHLAVAGPDDPTLGGAVKVWLVR